MAAGAPTSDDRGESGIGKVIMKRIRISSLGEGWNKVIVLGHYDVGKKG